MKPMSVPQLARKMGVSRVTVYKWVKSGRIRATRVGRNYVISAQTARRLLQQEITPIQRRWIDAAVKQTVEEFGELLKRLSRE